MGERMDCLEYKGYQGSVEFSAEDRCLHGKVMGIEDLVTYEAQSVEELEGAFRESVDDYLEMCEEEKREPDRRYSGRVMLRMGEELHRRVAIAAELEGASLNAWIASELDRISRERTGRGA